MSVQIVLPAANAAVGSSVSSRASVRKMLRIRFFIVFSLLFFGGYFYSCAFLAGTLSMRYLNDIAQVGTHFLIRV